MTMKQRPIQFVLLDFQQPAPDVWNAFVDFSQNWNGTHKNQFITTPEQAVVVTLLDGILDPETQELLDELHQLNLSYGLIWFVGMQDKRRPEDLVKADFIEIVGEQYPKGLIINESTALGDPQKCKECGKWSDSDRGILQKLIVDELVLEQRYAENTKVLLKNIDFIHIPNSGLLISNKVSDILNNENVKGFRCIDVVSKQTSLPLNNFHLIQAEIVLLLPCLKHTQVTESGICQNCGQFIGGLLSYYYIRKS